MRADVPEIFGQFDTWTTQYLAADAVARASLLAEGTRLAAERRLALRQLIEADPQLAIAEAVRYSVRMALPPEITTLLEERVSGVGDICITGRGAAAKDGVSADHLARTVRTGNRTLPAHVFGWRLVDQDFPKVPLHGVIVDGIMAVAESPVRMLDEAEKLAKKGATGQVAMEVGGDVQVFDSPEAAGNYERQLMYPLGLKPPGPREREALAKLPRVHRVHPNELAWQRINDQRSREGLRPLTMKELGVVPMGSELETVDATATSAGAPAAAPTPTTTGSSDNSGLTCFPPIRSQGSLGCCAAFSTTYYQMTHMTALARGWDAKNGGDAYRFSPKWTYNMVNGGSDAGSYIADNLSVQRDHGCATWSELPYDTNFRAWCLDSNVWRQAISRRMNTYSTIASLYTDAGLANLKAALDNGYVVTFDTYAPWTYQGWVQGTVGNDPATSLDDAYVGQQICKYVRALDWGHALTIVGYNDNLWCDLNGNGAVNTGEKGALKIANSWGTGWGNSGYGWFAYDALKTNSAVSGWNPSDKVYGIGYGDYSGNCIGYLTTAQASYNPKMVAKVTVSHALRNQVTLLVGKDTTSLTANPTTTWTPFGLSLDGGPYAFDGTTTACDATFYLDLTGLAPDPTSLKRYFVGLRDSSSDTAGGLLKAVTIMDLTTGGNLSLTPAANSTSFNPSTGSANGSTAWSWGDVRYGLVYADLSLALSGTPAPVTAGDALTYLFTVSNAGPFAADGINVIDSLPAGVSYVSSSASQGTCAFTSGTVTASLGTIASGSAATIRVVVMPAISGTLVNTGTLSTSTTDLALTNNSAQVSVMVPVDADADGMPDAWEIANGLNPHDPADCSADADQDGFTNLQECVAGTDPCSAASKLCVTDIHSSGSDFSLSFATVPGKSYSVEYKDSLTDNPWATQTTVTGTAASTQVTVPGALALPKRFYRVRLLP